MQRACGEPPPAGVSRCLCLRQSNQASVAPFACEVCRGRRRNHISDSGARCGRSGNPHHQESRRGTEPLYLPSSNRIRQPAEAGQTESAICFCRGSPGKPWHRYDLPALRSPARVLLPSAAHGDRVDHPTLYEILRIPASASPSELRVAFKLRDLELRTAGVRTQSESRWSGPSTSLVSPNCVLAMTRCLPIRKHQPYFRMVGLARFWLPANLPATDKHSSLAAFSRFHRSSGAGGSMFHCADAISTTTGHCAATRVASSSSGSTQPPCIHSGTVRGTSGNICWEQRSRSMARSYRLANTANVVASGNSLLGKLHCRAGWRSNCQPISSSNWTSARTTYHRFGQYSQALDQIRLCLEHRAVEKAELERMCSETTSSRRL